MTRFVTDTLITMERQALDRWGNGDPDGYFAIMAPEITYFDPVLERRANSRAEVEAHIRPFTGKIRVDRYEMVEPRVQGYGDVAILSYNLLSYVPGPDGPASQTVRWNATAVYTRVSGQWQIAHNHWSYIKPALRETMPNEGM
jgi:ketosteroid isomerase-like protein